MGSKTTLSYRVCANSSAGDWYWELMRDEFVIGRGIAPTEMGAHMNALDAVYSEATKIASEDLVIERIT